MEPDCSWLDPIFVSLGPKNHVKFIQECVMCMEKHGYSKGVWKWANHGFASKNGLNMGLQLKMG